MRKSLTDMVAALCDAADVPPEKVYVQNRAVNIVLGDDEGGRIVINHLISPDNGSEAARAWVIRMHLGNKDIWFGTACGFDWTVELIVRFLYPDVSQ